MASFFTFATLNVQGINNKTKMVKIFSLIEKLDFVVLTETKLNKPLKIFEFQTVFGAKFDLYHSHDQNAGISILISRRIQTANMTTNFEINGRVLGLSFSIGQRHLKLFAVYAPGNYGQRRPFYTQFRDQLTPEVVESELLIFGGDFNFVENPQTDRSNPNRTRERENGRREFQDIKNNFGMEDLEKQPDNKFTCASAAHGSQSRIDRFYGNYEIFSSVDKTQYRNVSFLDHKILL